MSDLKFTVTQGTYRSPEFWKMVVEPIKLTDLIMPFVDNEVAARACAVQFLATQLEDLAAELRRDYESYSVQ